MSIRKVSDLEGLNFESIYSNQQLSNQLLDSLLEVSYPVKTTDDSNIQLWSYKSMYAKYGDIKYNIMRTILSGDVDPEDPDPHPSVVFNVSSFFKYPVNMLCSLYLSGNFYLNLEYTDDEILAGKKCASRDDADGYEMYIRTTQNILCAIGEDGNDYVGNNILTAYRNNYIIANNCNVIDAYMTQFQYLDTPIADFKNDRVDFYVPVNIGNNLTVEGDVHVGGDVYANFFVGIATSAYWADLAEYYESDREYEPGTLVQFAGEKEITIATNEVNAVVSTKPAYLMNLTNLKNGINCPIALVGKVPIKILGKIKKFDKVMLSDTPGVGEKWNGDQGKSIIGRALESNDNNGIKLVECVTKFQI